MDRLLSMAVFVRSVELGSFAAAAEALRMSPTMVGKHVQYLETRLGVRLLNRTTRRQGLTAFGQAYYERARSILADVRDADALAANYLDTPFGTLKVTMPSLLGRLCVAPILMKLVEDYPSLRLSLTMDDRLTDIAAEGYDLAVRTGAAETGRNLEAIPAGSHVMIVCASPDYLARAGSPTDLSDLVAHDAILYVRSGLKHGWLFQDAEGATIETTPPSRLELDDLAAVADAAAAGLGLAWLPAWLAAPHLHSGTLKQVLDREPPYGFTNHLVWPKARYLPLRTRLAIDLLARDLPSALIGSAPSIS